MTANLTVPADVWACQQPGVPLVAAIVEGERVPCLRPGCGPPYGFCPNDESRPPAWLVALRDARCETCGGSGTINFPDDRPGWPWRRCDNCVDGRLLHDARVRCARCNTGGNFGGKCWECGSTGYRTVSGLIDVVPVCSPPGGTSDYRTANADSLLIVFPQAVEFWQRTDYSKHFARSTLTLPHVVALAAACGKPPAEWVGCWAWLFTPDER